MPNGYRASWIENHRGKDYWGKRLGNENCGNGPGRHKSGKKKTHMLERAEKRRILHQLKEEL